MPVQVRERAAAQLCENGHVPKQRLGGGHHADCCGDESQNELDEGHVLVPALTPSSSLLWTHRLKGDVAIGFQLGRASADEHHQR